MTHSREEKTQEKFNLKCINRFSMFNFFWTNYSKYVCMHNILKMAYSYMFKKNRLQTKLENNLDKELFSSLWCIRSVDRNLKTHISFWPKKSTFFKHSSICCCSLHYLPKNSSFNFRIQITAAHQSSL